MNKISPKSRAILLGIIGCSCLPLIFCAGLCGVSLLFEPRNYSNEHLAAATQFEKKLEGTGFRSYLLSVKAVGDADVELALDRTWHLKNPPVRESDTALFQEVWDEVQKSNGLSGGVVNVLDEFENPPSRSVERTGSLEEEIAKCETAFVDVLRLSNSSGVFTDARVVGEAQMTLTVSEKWRLTPVAERKKTIESLHKFWTTMCREKGHNTPTLVVTNKYGSEVGGVSFGGPWVK
ncbi:MAG: hypothetical protein AAFP69_15855 [Planctomycetota bacterium]